MNKWLVFILAVIVFAGVSSFGAYIFGHHQGFAKGYAVQSKALATSKSKVSVLESEQNSNFSLSFCLNQVDSWYNTNRNIVTTIAQESALNDEKSQRVHECQLRYPSH
jgi:hypothetical protein